MDTSTDGAGPVAARVLAGWTVAALFVFGAVAPGARAGSPDEIFGDGFGSGDPSSWTDWRGYFEDWPKFRRDLANTGFSLERELSSTNVGTLSEKWTFNTGVKISASPAVATVDGVRSVYIGNWDGVFFAIDADAGTERWRYVLDQDETETCSTSPYCRITSSPAVAGGFVYFGAQNGKLYALDAATGDHVWSRLLGDPAEGYEIWSSPAVYDGVVYVGVASQDSAPCVPGRVVALDAATGADVWSFDTIDQSTCPTYPPDECVGAGIWSSPALDLEFGTLFVGTGNAGEGCIPSEPNAELYPDGILALDLVNGSFKSFFQTFPNDTNDLGDVGAAPALHTTRVTDQCLGTDETEYWVSVPSKDSVFHTARRSVVGLASDPTSLTMGTGRALASPPVIPRVETASCGPGLEQTLVGNDLFAPTSHDVLWKIRQEATGETSLAWQKDLHDCAESACPIFSSPAATTDLIFFGGGTGNLHAARVSDGEILRQLGTLGLVAGGPAISHATVYYGSYDGILYAASIDGE